MEEAILDGKKADVVIIRKIGERSAIRRETPVVNAVAGFQKFVADSALGSKETKIMLLLLSVLLKMHNVEGKRAHW